MEKELELNELFYYDKLKKKIIDLHLDKITEVIILDLIVELVNEILKRFED